MGLLDKFLGAARQAASGGVYTGPAGLAYPLPAQVQESTRQVGGMSDDVILAEERRLGPIVSRILAEVGRHVAPGVSTQALADGLTAASLAEQTLPAMYGFKGFPAAAAVSINEEVVHGIPATERRIARGDLLKLEFGLVSGRGFAAQSWTFAAGPVRAEDRVLLDTGPRALRAALAVLKAQCRLGDIGSAIQSTVEKAGLSVVRDFVGYGMGKKRIQEPPVHGHGKAGFGPRLSAGTVLNIHVILKHGSPEVEVNDNQWTALASDGQRAALFTCMAEITADSHRSLTPLLAER